VNLSISAKNRLIFALDVPDRKEAESYVRALGDTVGCFKVGLELFIKEGPDVLKLVKQNSSASIFLDLKLHDIPATVRSALRSAPHMEFDSLPFMGRMGDQFYKPRMKLRT